jgi:hypothetical protein
MSKLLPGLLVLGLLAPTAEAGPISYTFTGEGGLTGGFVLDDEAAWEIEEITDPSTATFGKLSSPLHSLWGTLGSYEFSGTPTLQVQHWDDSEFQSLERWIVRADLTSSGGSPAMKAIGLHLWTGNISDISLVPPLIDPHPLNFVYIIEFSDGSTLHKQLESVAMVPVVTVREAPSMLVPMIACAALALGLLFQRGL